MARTVDYYLFLISPWSYLATGRLNALRQAHDVTMRYKPIDVGRTFADMGGTPPAKRHPSRQRFRLDELSRWSARLDVPINLKPAHFPTDQSLAARMVYALEPGQDVGPFCDAVLRAVWAEERDIADADTLVAIADDLGLGGAALVERARDDAFAQALGAATDEAHAADVFGSPTWVLDGENFWGQDRLDFLEEALRSGTTAPG